MRIFKYPSNRNLKHRRPARPPVPALEWVRDISGKAARTTAIGSRQLLVENHTGILDFSDTSVSLNTGCGPIVISGDGLSLSDVRMGTLIVRGMIRQVQLPCEGSLKDEG